MYTSKRKTRHNLIATSERTHFPIFDEARRLSKIPQTVLPQSNRGAIQHLTCADANTQEDANRTEGKGDQIAAKTNEIVNIWAPRIGLNPGHVTVHLDHDAQRRTSARQVPGMVSGGEIYINRNYYKPDSDDGRLLLGHELAHLAQQRRSAGRSSQNLDLNPVHVEADATSVANELIAGYSSPCPRVHLDRDAEVYFETVEMDLTEDDYGARQLGWRRIQGTLFGPEGRPSPAHIDQGDVGDCWILSPLASIAAYRPDLIMSNVVQVGDNIHVHLYDLEQPPVRHRYIISPHFPTDNSAGDVTPGGSRQGVFWVAAYERAFRWHRRWIEDISEGGYSETAFQIITGTVGSEGPESIQVGNYLLNEPVDVIYRHIWTSLHRRGWAVTISTKSEENMPRPENQLPVYGPSTERLYPDHVYAVIRAFTQYSAGTHSYYLKLRNPHGVDDQPGSTGRDMPRHIIPIVDLYDFFAYYTISELPSEEQAQELQQLYEEHEERAD